MSICGENSLFAGSIERQERIVKGNVHVFLVIDKTGRKQTSQPHGIYFSVRVYPDKSNASGDVFRFDFVVTDGVRVHVEE